MKLPPPPCATADTDEINRGRREKRRLRWVATAPESLCCVGARSVLEITREVTVLTGKDRGKRSVETVYYVSSRPMQPGDAEAMLQIIRTYWRIEAGHHSLDVTAREDASRVRDRHSLLVLGLARRATLSCHRVWRAGRKNQRQSTLRDFHDEMNRHQHRRAWQLFKGSKI